MSDIFVGVDGSPASVTALDWALRQARQSGQVVVAVHAYRPTPSDGPLPHRLGYSRLSDRVAGELGDVERERAQERTQVDRSQAEALVARALASCPTPHADLVVKRVVVRGPASRVLLQLVDADDLLVVGTGRRNRGPGQRLGSVARRCVEHARGTVVVAR